MMTQPKPPTPAIDEILHDFAVNLHAYATGKGQASDYDKYKQKTKTALNQFYAEEMQRTANEIFGLVNARPNSSNYIAGEEQDEILKAIKDRWLGGSSNGI